MTELLVHPYRDGNELRVNQYYGLLSSFPNLEWVPPDLALAGAAARIRAQYRLRTPDALQIATALRAGAAAMLTNDPAFARVREIEIGVLDQLR
jgi:predicted nucleic acid-binding protein